MSKYIYLFFITFDVNARISVNPDEQEGWVADVSISLLKLKIKCEQFERSQYSLKLDICIATFNILFINHIVREIKNRAI